MGGITIPPLAFGRFGDFLADRGFPLGAVEGISLRKVQSLVRLGNGSLFPRRCDENTIAIFIFHCY